MKAERVVRKFLELYNRAVRFCIGKLIGLFGIQWSEKRWTGFLTFARFWLIGLSAALVNYIANVICLLFLHGLQKGYDFIIANSVAFVVSVIWTFYWNNKYVFLQDEEHRRSLVKTFVKTFMTYAFTGLILNNALSYVWIYIAGISKYTAPVLNMLIGFPVNYAINKLWTYK